MKATVASYLASASGALRKACGKSELARRRREHTLLQMAPNRHLTGRTRFPILRAMNGLNYICGICPEIIR
jgi:hypothetical protein